jgi:hypothetical protein
MLIHCYPVNAIRGNSMQLKETNTSEAMVQQTDAEMKFPTLRMSTDTINMPMQVHADSQTQKYTIVCKFYIKNSLSHACVDVHAGVSGSGSVRVCV